MVNKTKALERKRTRLIKSQNSGQVDLRRMRRLRRVNTKFWTSKKKAAVLGEKIPREQPKAKKKKRKEEPELEVIEKKPEVEEVDELDELYTYDEEIEEESTETKEKPEVEKVDEVPLETEENPET
ncbi:MAG: hypothetical protein KAJ96_08170 [Candidatus Thorarchaeota archaeon]|nr:hypothetical protein [Candidatus Thorarchaeota archaeon]